jgi:diguanylate cyclase (GGDEF)-like protein/PAS domain S-box-containing protein
MNNKKDYTELIKELDEYKLKVKKLKENEERILTMLDASSDSIYLIDRDYRYLFVNNELLSRLGLTRKQVMGKTFVELHSPYEKEFIMTVDQVFKTVKSIKQEHMSKGLNKWFLRTISPVKNCNEGKITEAVVVSKDITERKKNEEEILHLSYHDSMTDIYNRAFFEEEKKRLDTNRQLPLSVIMGDLNGLKLINDAFGHNEGDKIIKEAAEILKRVCRFDDIVARWGGDEFVVLLPKTSASGSEEILERIKKECEKTISQKIPLSLSLGTATKEEISQPIDLIITDSESNMYKNKLGERENISNSIRTALEQALYEKSNETADHTGRIKELALKLGRRVKLTSSQLDDLSILASLHDIGKVAIPEKILMKKGKLTEKEWEIIKRHPVVGFNIAIASTQIVHVAKSILACHEHWDGSGYPNGLKGESAPIASRIILIADAYEVMTSGRTYKKPISKDEAIEELKRCAGTQFDPILVNKFIEIISGNI